VPAMSKAFCRRACSSKNSVVRAFGFPNSVLEPTIIMQGPARCGAAWRAAHYSLTRRSPSTCCSSTTPTPRFPSRTRWRNRRFDRGRKGEVWRGEHSGTHRTRSAGTPSFRTRIARETGRTPAQIVVNWCLCRDGVFCHPWGGSLKHILENCAASDWRLTPEQIDLPDTKVHYRRHNRFDRLARRSVPHSLQRIAVRVSYYPARSVRRRIIVIEATQ